MSNVRFTSAHVLSFNLVPKHTNTSTTKQTKEAAASSSTLPADTGYIMATASKGGGDQGKPSCIRSIKLYSISLQKQDIHNYILIKTAST